MPPKSKVVAVSCSSCKYVIAESNDNSIGCDKCSGWFHASCQNLSTDEFNVLSLSTAPWYCNLCNVTPVAKSQHSTHASDKPGLTQSTLEDSVSFISTQLAKLSAQFNVFNKTIESRIDDLEKRLNVYVDDKIASATVALTDAFNEKVANIEQLISLKFTQRLSEANDKTKVLASRMDKKYKEIDTNFASLQAGSSTSPQAKLNFVQLYEQVERLEREKRQCNILIEGIPECEHTKDLSAIIIRLADCMGTHIMASDFECVRFSKKTNGPSSRATPILVKFASLRVRETVMQSYIAKRNLLFSHVLPELNIATRVYINDHLTPASSALLKRCALLKRKNVIMQYFSRHGLIYIKYGINERPHKTDHNELLKLELPNS